MHHPTLTEAARAMVHHTQQTGRKPLAFVMNETTATAIAQEITAVYRQQRSILQRALFWLRHRRDTPCLEHLHGYPVKINKGMIDGGILLQSIDPTQMPTAEELRKVNAPDGGVPAEFLKRERVEPADIGQNLQVASTDEIRPTLDDLAKGSGDRPSATDVLIKALEGAESLRGVVVIRVHSGGDVDLCLNVNEFEASGVLQKAHQYLAMRGM